MSETILGTDDNSAITQNQTVNDNNTPDVQQEKSTPEVAWDKLITEGGFFAENWKEALPEEIRNEPCLNNMKNIGTLAKSYVSSQKMVGANKIAVPGENASEEEWNAFYKAGGRPEEASKYNFDEKTLPEGISISPEQMAAFKEIAFEAGLSQKAFQKAVQWDIERTQQAIQTEIREREKEYSETLTRLKQEQGPGLQQYINQCNRAMEHWGITNLAREKGLLNNYEFITAMARIGAAISESRLPDGDLPNKDPQSRINEILANKEGPYYRRDDPRHEAAVQEMRELIAAKSQR